MTLLSSRKIIKEEIRQRNVECNSGTGWKTILSGFVWRLLEIYIFITDASSYDQVENPDSSIRQQWHLKFPESFTDYPVDTLFETIEGFHDTKARFEVFKRAVETDIKSRAAGVKKEIQFVLDHEDVACCFSNLQAKGEIRFVLHTMIQSLTIL